MQSVCLLAEVVLATVCTLGNGTQWQLDVVFGNSRDPLGTAVSRPLALLANLFCKMGETACLALSRDDRDIQILQTDQVCRVSLCDHV